MAYSHYTMNSAVFRTGDPAQSPYLIISGAAVLQRESWSTNSATTGWRRAAARVVQRLRIMALLAAAQAAAMAAALAAALAADGVLEWALAA